MSASELRAGLVDDVFLKVSSGRRMVNISGTVGAIDLKFSQGKDMGHQCLNKKVYYSATTTMVAEIGTK
jgi:hypothetical protein